MKSIERNLTERFFEEGKTYKQFKIILQDSYRGERGISTNSVKRYSQKHNLSPRINEICIDEIVAEAVDEVNLQRFTYFSHVF